MNHPDAHTEVLVFDTGPLTHFAKEGWLGTLKAIVGDRRALVPDVVVSELEVGAILDGRVKSVLEADWLVHRELSAPAEMAALATFTTRLVVGRRNLGECAVLALGQVLGATVVVDDGAARKAAHDHGIACKPTLSLLCEGIRNGLLTIDLVSHLADDLIRGDYRLPFPVGGFRQWAIDNGVVPEPRAG